MTLIFMMLLLLSAKTGFGQNDQSTENYQEGSPGVVFSGFVRAASFFGGSGYDIAELFSEFKLNTETTFKHASFKSDIRLRSGSSFGEKNNELEIKSLYASIQNEVLHLTIGNQIVDWGRADGYNPTNNLTPKNYFFLTSDPNDQQLSNFMAKLKYIPGEFIDLELIMIPLYKPSVYRYDLIPVGQNVEFSDIKLPEPGFSSAGYAGRVNFEYPFAGISVSYFNGYSCFYGFDYREIRFDPTGSITIYNEPKPYRKQAIGLDFAIPASFMIIRGEAALDLVDDQPGIFVPDDALNYVAGIEKEMFKITLILQYIGKYNFDFEALIVPDPSTYDLANPLDQVRFAKDMSGYEMTLFNRKLFGQQFESGHAVSAYLRRPFAHDAVNAELAGMYDIRTEEWMIRPKLSWKINDQISVALGGIYLTGPEKSLFHYSKSILNGFFGDFRVSF